MQHMVKGDNLGLITSRLTRGEDFEHTHVTQNLLEKIYLSSKTSNNAFLFPLYEYPEEREDELFELDDDGSAWQLSTKGRRPNLSLAFVDDLTARLGRRFVYDDITTDTGAGAATVTPEDIFHYAYALFHSPTYRQRYAEFLKIDFPRLPLTRDGDLFDTLVGYGAELVQYHLMQHPALAQTPVGFHSTGDTTVKKRTYDAQTQRVTINKSAYFDHVPPQAWDFHIGGYQVLDKWLKDRKGRALDHNDAMHYSKIVQALLGTQALMHAIDEALPAFPLA